MKKILISLSDETEQRLRKYLNRNKYRKGDLSKYIEGLIKDNIQKK